VITEKKNNKKMMKKSITREKNGWQENGEFTGGTWRDSHFGQKRTKKLYKNGSTISVEGRLFRSGTRKGRELG